MEKDDFLFGLLLTITGLLLIASVPFACNYADKWIEKKKESIISSSKTDFTYTVHYDNSHIDTIYVNKKGRLYSDKGTNKLEVDNITILSTTAPIRELK